MMTNLLCGVVERKVQCQTNTVQELTILEKGALTCPMYKPVFHNGTKKKKVVIDFDVVKY